ncbi:MAG TPA: hypothetical protein VI583_04165 [Cyclobacteriaceae bacterium]|nr:hypothetical protein [Cyclobacteriaceae bacterium]
MRYPGMLLIFLLIRLTGMAQNISMDLNNKEVLKHLGIGRIIETDKTMIRNITLHELKESWIIYKKDGSLHDLLMEKISLIEFPESMWGSVTIEFPENMPKISLMYYEPELKIKRSEKE